MPSPPLAPPPAEPGHDAPGAPARPLVTGGEADPFLHHLTPLFARATDAAIVAAFIWDSGLKLLHEPMSSALARGARIRILTGDYMAATQVEALARLLDWMSAEAVRAEESPDVGMPGEFQQEALAALARSREDGCQRALVVLATGLGKTWLAAFDVHAFAGARGNRLPRVLFLAHRAELLRQAAETFRRLLRAEYPGARLGWYAGDRSELDADVVLASIQKLARPEGLEQLTLLARPGAAPFDYVVVDEVHHAAAPSYRKILERLSPAFLLGLTATPDRADNGDVLGLFDDHVAYRADVGAGIARGRLVPFAYFGLKDDVDYRPENIPWRNRRFDQDALERAVQTRRRMEQLWGAWGEHPGTRTLVFCCSIQHATFVRDWLRAQGVRVEAVYSAPGSADRAESLAALAEGKLDALCAVDLFNEGVDLPLLDRVVMLRPTESPVVFLQQLGRGLRRADGKRRLTVIDFVGNHRVFLGRVRALLSLARTEVSLVSFVKTPDQLELPPGCSIDIELEAIALIEKLLPRGQTEVERAYRELYATRGERPTAGELFRLGYLPGTLRPRYGGWFDFIAAEGHLGPGELRVREQARAWLEHLEAVEVSSCFKLVMLEALLEAGALTRGLELDELARRSHGILLRSPELLRDVEDSEELKDPRRPAPERWLSYWNKHAVAAWTEPGESQRAWFVVEDNRLSSRLPALPEDEAVLAEMTRELVDYRLARYRARRREDETGASFECKVTWNKRDPILKLPSRSRRPDLPFGDTDVRLEDGSPWRFRFVKEFCNVARPVGVQGNQLPDLARRWFGPAAGKPGTAFHVRFSRAPDGWRVAPIGARVVALPERGQLIAFPTLRAAAGAAGGVAAQAPEAEEVRLPIPARGMELFAVRAAGDSMDGGVSPIRDGDWLVMKYARGAGIGAMDGRVALVQVPDAHEGHTYQVKRVVREGDAWQLRSDNPERSSYPATAETVPLATLVQVVRPESLAPPEGKLIDEDELEEAFQLSAAPPTHGRVDGHLFLRIEDGAAFTAPDRLRAPVADRRPGETAYVLVRVRGDSRWSYRGVARWNDAEGLWHLPTTE